MQYMAYESVVISPVSIVLCKLKHKTWGATTTILDSSLKKSLVLFRAPKGITV